MSFNTGVNLLVYDFEVVKNDWIIVLKRYMKDEFIVLHNDADALITFLSEEQPLVLAGFNNKHYDQFILKAITQHRDPSEVKEVNDWIISGKNPYEHPFFSDRNNGMRIAQLDVRDDMQDGISLKAIEAHMGWDIRESSVPFDIDRPLNFDELQEMISYCKADVSATEEIIKMRSAYLDAKVDLGEMAGLSKGYSLGISNATLTAKFLDAEAKTFNDEREYLLPDSLFSNWIPSVVKDFFKRGSNYAIPDSEVFQGQCEFSIGECPVTVAWGGIHAAIPTYHEEETEERVIRNWDVASLYPSLMIQYGYTSRCMADPQRFKNVYETRIKAKREGDKKTANTLKLVLNTTYGAMLLPSGPLFDPKMGRSVCVGGQLLILELAMHLADRFDSLKIIQLNTDGIMVSCMKSDLPKIHEIIDEWQTRVRLTLEEDEIRFITQKDVNNYVMQTTDGHFKTKGAYFKQGVSLVGAFSVNNDFNIVKKAVFEQIANGIPVEDTINACDDPSQFQLVARGGSKYSKVTHSVDGAEIEVQKCNRVYASKDTKDGILYKYHRETGRPSKIANCPEHCFIENSSDPVDINRIEKKWYIALAKKRVADFYPKAKKVKGEQIVMDEIKEVVQTKEEPTVVKTEPMMKPMKVLAKLARARHMLLDSGIKATGNNKHMKFRYLELGDFVPQVTRIFDEVGLISIFNVFDDQAHMTIVNVDDPADSINFNLPFVRPTGNQAVPEVQSIGSGVTYYRRYLYLISMDIAVNDEIDAETVEESVFKPSAPASPAKPTTAAPSREEAKAQLTQASNKPTEEDVKELKSALIALREVPGNENYIQQVAMETKGFTDFTHERKEAYMIEIGKRVAEGGK